MGGTGSAKSTSGEPDSAVCTTLPAGDATALAVKTFSDYNIEALRNQVSVVLAKERAVLRHHSGQPPLG